MLKYILFTHTDLDGAGCSILFDFYMRDQGFRKGFDDDYIIINTTIDDIPKSVNNIFNFAESLITSETEIIFADLCCDPSLMKDIAERFNTVKVFDHHETNTWANDFPGIEAYVYETLNNRMECGTSIMWSYYYKDRPSSPNLITFVNAVRSYDTFEFKSIPNKNAIILNKYLNMVGMSLFCDLQVSFLEDMTCADPSLYHGFKSVADLFEHITILSPCLGNIEISVVSPFEELIINAQLDMEKNKIQKIVSGEDTRVFKVPIMDSGKSYIVFNIIPGINMSDLAAEYLSAHPEYDVFVWFDLNRKALSFRSIRDDINVSETAIKFNGGGHPRASGGKLPLSIHDKIHEIIKTKLFTD